MPDFVSTNQGVPAPEATSQEKEVKRCPLLGTSTPSPVQAPSSQENQLLPLLPAQPLLEGISELQGSSPTPQPHLSGKGAGILIPSQWVRQNSDQITGPVHLRLHAETPLPSPICCEAGRRPLRTAPSLWDPSPHPCLLEVAHLYDSRILICPSSHFYKMASAHF